MKRLWILLLCAALLGGCRTQKTEETESNVETESAPASETTDDTELLPETETAAEEEKAESETQSESYPVQTREITLDPDAKGYIYLYTYTSLYGDTAFYCTDTPLADDAMADTQKIKPDGLSFATNTTLPSAEIAEAVETAEAADTSALTLYDVISCTEAYPEYAYVQCDDAARGYLFFRDGIWKAYALTDASILPLSKVDPAITDPDFFNILRDSADAFRVRYGYVMLQSKIEKDGYTQGQYALYDLTRDDFLIEGMTNFTSLCGDYFTVSDYDSAQTTLYNLGAGTCIGSLNASFVEMHAANGKYYISEQDSADGEMPFSIYNVSLQKIASSPINQFTTTADGYGVVIDAERTGYRIFDTDGTTAAEISGFDQVVKLYAGCDYVCVAYDGWLQFRQMHDGAFLANLCPYDVERESSENRQYVIHTMISGYSANENKSSSVIDYADAEPDADGKYDYSVSRFAVNTGTAVEPKFTIERYPDTLPSGVYIMVEESDVPEQTFPEDGTAHTVEYYLTDNGELYRIESGFMGGYAKPVLYLYPETETELSVAFAHPESLTTVYPAYPAGGWHVVAQPDGTLRTVTDGTVSKRTYYALYWEESGAVPCDFSTGFCVAREDSAAFLEDSLAALGFTDREANECILYWLPILEKSPYNLISFEQTNSREDCNALQICPQPDSLLRVALHILPVTEPVEMEPQTLPAFVRRGFTAVEWGGTYGG